MTCLPSIVFWFSSYLVKIHLIDLFGFSCRFDKSPVNRAHLRWQIHTCYHLLSKNKGQYYQDLIKEYIRDGKKKWQVLSNVLGRTRVFTLPSCTSEKSLANLFGAFYEQN